MLAIAEGLRVLISAGGAHHSLRRQKAPAFCIRLGQTGVQKSAIGKEQGERNGAALLWHNDDISDVPPNRLV